MRVLRALKVVLCIVVLIQLFASEIVAQRYKSPWQTLSGDAPLVIARGGFSGLFPDSSLDAYNFATAVSVPNVVLWCDVQLTKDAFGICFPDLNLSNASSIEYVYPNQQKSYSVNGVPTKGSFTIDFSLKDLKDVYLMRGILSRSEKFDQNGYTISTVENVAKQIKPRFFWLNVQHDTFYQQHNLSMSSFLIATSKTVSIDFISSPEVNFFRKLTGSFEDKVPSFVFQFLGKEDVEPTTNQTYGSILSNLTFVKAFASGILVPKSYIWPLDDKQYLLPHTSLVQDAHKAGLKVYASGFANDIDIAYNYSFDPVFEYLSFVDNGDFSVDGLLSDFPNSASASVECFAHIARNATKQVDFLVISKNGASGDYPGCTDLAYEKAIKDGADVIDCSVQMSSDGVPFCLGSIDLANSTTVVLTPLRNRTTNVPEISSVHGIFTFSLTWSEIQNLTRKVSFQIFPLLQTNDRRLRFYTLSIYESYFESSHIFFAAAISNPYRDNVMFRNPSEKNCGKLISLHEFLDLAKKSTSLSGVLIIVENAAYLREKQGLDVVKAVLDTLTDSGYKSSTTTKLMIQSTDSSVLVDFKKQSQYVIVYKIDEVIKDILDYAIEYIKTFANAVVIQKKSVFPTEDSFITKQTNVMEKLQKSQLPVYVETFRNEFVSQPFDFFSDATVEINSYIYEAGINGTITEFPLTAARYKRNRCLGTKDTTPYMPLVPPGGLLGAMSPQSLPPAQAPNLIITDADIVEPPLPPVTEKAPTSTPGAPLTNEQAPNEQIRLIPSILLLSSTSLINLMYYFL